MKATGITALVTMISKNVLLRKHASMRIEEKH